MFTGSVKREQAVAEPGDDVPFLGPRYRLEKKLGAGATAIVYSAMDTVRNQRVAIKVLREELAQSLGAAQFIKEIRLTSGLTHERIARVLDSGEFDGQLFYVLPYYSGGSLRDRLRAETQLPIDDVMAIAKSIAAALDAAHASGVIHRDVKPENILFEGGAAHLADFGVARAIQISSGDFTTSQGFVRGTPQYMSPEQASGDRELDARADVYSIACVLYELLGGEPAFTGPTTQAVIARQMTDTPRSLRVIRPTVPPAVEQAIGRALSKVPADRFSTAGQLAEALARARLEIAPGVESARRSWRRASWAAAATLAVALGAGAVFWPRGAAPTFTDVISDGDPRRIAVLYLDEHTPDALPAHVADGITEDLIDRLSAVRALRVISPNGVRPFRRSTVSLDSIVRTLRVGTIVGGSIARNGDSVRVTVRLIEARSGDQLNEKSWVAPSDDLFALQDTLGEQVTFFLRQRVGDVVAIQSHRSQTRSSAAWIAVQLASAATRDASLAIVRGDTMYTRLYLRADSLYMRASESDPAWTLPVIRRGKVALSGLSLRSPVPPEGYDSTAYANATLIERRRIWLRRALDLAGSVLRRDAKSPEGQALRGEALVNLIVAGAGPRDSLVSLADNDLRAALDARPDLAEAWVALADLSVRRGLFGDAMDAVQRGIDADAYFEQARTLALAFTAALHAERFDEARRWCRLSNSLYPRDPRFVQCDFVLLAWVGRSRKDVEAMHRQLLAIEGDSMPSLGSQRGLRRLMLAAVLARSGMRDSARALVASTMAGLAGGVGGSSTFPAAYVHLNLGETQAAIELLVGHVRKSPADREYVAAHPWFRAAHGDSVFDATMRLQR
jgi:TolB-like protein/tRNA A-37 threonylcarbamoyl transferase component Bud32/tetratricopeptide (TPR) repeat protein